MEDWCICRISPSRRRRVQELWKYKSCTRFEERNKEAPKKTQEIMLAEQRSARRMKVMGISIRVGNWLLVSSFGLSLLAFRTFKNQSSFNSGLEASSNNSAQH
ncbi:hypothetical protein L2E82_01000 [Cichorium intybus]|uniref:Uncharacterized protein n=1 Tax=Cichorium intybus TaxID=13427 RepID=A0ACB9GZ40_CICIN|nr:hypothetical protein L2E82_01000 [Cichorium intybus]